MSGSLKPDRQFDFSGGESDFVSRFTTPPNGVYQSSDFFPQGKSIVNSRNLVEVITAARGVATLLPGGRTSDLFVVWQQSLDTEVSVLVDNGTRTNFGTMETASNSHFATAYQADDLKSHVNIRYHTNKSEFFTVDENGFTLVAGAPTPFSILVGHLGYDFLVGGGTEASPNSNVRYSVQNDHTTWPVLSDFDIGPTGSPIYGAASLRGVLFIFKEHEIWAVTGQGPGTSSTGGLADFTAHIVSNSLGTRYHHSIKEIDGRLWFLSNRGLVAFDGVNAQVISRNLDLRDVDLGRGRTGIVGMFSLACGSVYSPEEHLYRLFMPYHPTDVGISRRTYAFDTTTGAMYRSDRLSGSTSANKQVVSGGQFRQGNTTPIRRMVFLEHDQDAADVNILMDGSLYHGGAILQTGFRHWGAPELPKWPTKIQIFANPEASFSSGVIASEDQSVDLGAISVPASGIATIPIPQSMNGGANFYGLKLTTNAVECRIDGIVFWGHVGDSPREET